MARGQWLLPQARQKEIQDARARFSLALPWLQRVSFLWRRAPEARGLLFPRRRVDPARALEAAGSRRRQAPRRALRRQAPAARAARGGGDPDANPTLRTFISKAKEVNMPADTIKRAIQRGTGELPGVQYEEFTLEGYGPGGTGILMEITTDNRNRTVAEIRSLLGKNSGNMAEAGAVAWQFDKKGLLIVEGNIEEDLLLNVALEAGS